MSPNKGQQIRRTWLELALLHNKICKNMLKIRNIFLIMYIPENWCGNERVIEKMMILPIKWHRNCLQTKLENVKGQKNPE